RKALPLHRHSQHAPEHGQVVVDRLAREWLLTNEFLCPELLDHAEAVADMAIEMGRVLSTLEGDAFATLNIRIGIHTGLVVAGVIGISPVGWRGEALAPNRAPTHFACTSLPGAPARVWGYRRASAGAALGNASHFRRERPRARS